MKELVERAGTEIGTLIGMAFDDTPNSSQLGEFFSTGTQAFKDLADTVGQLPKEKRAAAISHFLNKVHERANETIPALELD
ncbi:MAG: hypothetical protein LAN84_15595 [Acidobacteriia bacterium]|nr:hypothetical protein [Terriglobia bacterium]